MRCHVASAVRSEALRRRCLSLENICSMGLRSGEYGGDKELLDPLREAGPVDRLIEHTRRIDPAAAQRGDEGHGAPVAIGNLGPVPLALGSPAAQGSRVGLGPSLVNEDKPLGVDAALKRLPAFAFAGNVRPFLLTSERGFF